MPKSTTCLLGVMLILGLSCDVGTSSRKTVSPTSVAAATAPGSTPSPERIAADRITSHAGAFVYWQGSDEQRHVTRVSITGWPENVVADLRNLPQLQQVTVCSETVDRKRLREIACLRDLRSVRLSCPLTDADLAVIAGAARLEDIRLDAAEVTDDGLTMLPRSLRELGLHDRRSVSDGGMATIATLGSLTWLDLSGTRITDQGVLSLSQLSKLSYLDVRQTAVTGVAVEKLKSLLPQTTIPFAVDATRPSPR